MRFSFRDFEVDESLFSLTKNGIKQDLEPRVFELLLYFCKHPNVPISRDELIEHVWQQRVVGNAAINRAVSELRKIIESNPAKPEIITTVSKIGYQLSITPTILSSVSRDSNDTIINTSPQKQIIEQPIKQTTRTRTRTTAKTTQLASNNSTQTFLAALSTVLLIVILIAGYFSLNGDDENAATAIVERPLTSLKGTAFKGKLSGDGEILLFIHKANSNSNTDIWLQKNDAKAMRLTNDSYYYTFAVFGDNNQVFASRFNNLQERSCEIVSINMLTSEITTVLACTNRSMTTLAYSSVDNTLYFNGRDAVNSAYSIYSYNLATQRKRQVTLPYSDGNIRGDYLVSLSPKSERLAVLEYQENGRSLIKIITLKDKAVNYLKHDLDPSASISWLSNNSIAVSDGTGIKSYQLNNDEPKQLVANSNIGYVSANPLTQKMIFDKSSLTANIYQYQLHEIGNSNNHTAITNSSSVNYLPMMANTSNKSAYLSTDNGELAIMISPEKEEAYNAVFTKEIKSLINYHWSPDDNYLVASINNQIQLFNEKTKQWQTLLPEQQNIHFVYFSNKDTIIFSSDVSGDWQIWQYDIDSTSISQLTTHGGYSAQGNVADGSLYLTKFNTNGLYHLDLDTGKETKLIDDFDITSWKKWYLVHQNIYYLKNKSIYAFNAEQLTDKKILSLPARAPSSFSISFNEQYLQREVIEDSSGNIWQIKLSE